MEAKTADIWYGPGNNMGNCGGYSGVLRRFTCSDSPDQCEDDDDD